VGEDRKGMRKIKQIMGMGSRKTVVSAPVCRKVLSPWFASRFGIFSGLFVELKQSG
jgi:hypothetical protein